MEIFKSFSTLIKSINIQQKSKYCSTPLLLSTTAENLETKKIILVNNINVDYENEYGTSALIMCC